MRLVHDICFAANVGNGQRVCVAFIQHGTKDTGYIYENICPWCATTLEKVTVSPLADVETVMNRLLMGMTKHYRFCVHRGTGTLQVEKTDHPLNVEKVIREV